MSGLRRPGTLSLGDQVRYGDAMRTVIGFAGPVVRLADASGGVEALPLASLLASPGFELAAARDRLTGCPAAASCAALARSRPVSDEHAGSGTGPPPLAARPDPPFGQVPAAAPGELVQIDSTPLDVLVLLDDGTPGRVELTGMIDVATRSVTAAVLRPSAKSVDACVLLARTLTPEPMRPGWADALRMSRSALPYQRLLSIDERLEHAAARPVIVPHAIVCDHGKVFLKVWHLSGGCAISVRISPAWRQLHGASYWPRGGEFGFVRGYGLSGNRLVPRAPLRVP